MESPGAAGRKPDVPGESLPKDSPRFSAAIIALRFNCMPPTKTNGVFASATRQLKLNNCKVEFALMLALRTGEAMLFAKKLYIGAGAWWPLAAALQTTGPRTTGLLTTGRRREKVKS